MSRHSTAFEIESPVPAGDPATELLRDISNKPEVAAGVPPAAKKFNFRKALLTGAALAMLAGTAWYGWDTGRSAGFRSPPTTPM